MQNKDALALAVKSAREMGAAEERAKYERARPTASPEFAEKSLAEFSFTRVIQSLMAKDTSFAKKEWEMSRDLCKDQYKEKTLTLANDAAGGFLVPDEVRRDMLIPYLRVQSVMDRAKVTRMSGLNYSPVKFPRQSGIETGYWVGETQAITASDSATDQMSLTPHKAGVAQKISNTLIRKAPAAAEQFVRTSVAETHKRFTEKAFFEGTGLAGQPLGLKNISGINTVSFTSRVGSNIFIKLQSMIQALEEDNANIDSCVWVMHPTDYHVLAQFAVPQAGVVADPLAGYPVLSNGSVASKTGRELFGYPILVTANITQDTIFLFDAADVVFADWGAMELRVTDAGQTLALDDNTLVVCVQEVDVNAFHPVSICTGTAFDGT